MSNASLLLYPSNSTQPPPLLGDLAAYLYQRGVIATPLPTHRYPLGDHFLRDIAFMGCSPAIRLEPAGSDDHGYCYLTLEGPFDPPQLRHGRNTRPPRCPHCHQGITPWQAAISGTPLPCPHCHHTAPLDQLLWRHNAGYARLFITIHNIFPGEAIPQPGLLNDLTATFNQPWGYCFRS